MPCFIFHRNWPTNHGKMRAGPLLLESAERPGDLQAGGLFLPSPRVCVSLSVSRCLLDLHYLRSPSLSAAEDKKASKNPSPDVRLIMDHLTIVTLWVFYLKSTVYCGEIYCNSTKLSLQACLSFFKLYLRNLSHSGSLHRIFLTTFKGPLCKSF